MKAIFQNEEIGDPAYDGLTFGGYALTTPLLKADYPGLHAIRLEDGTVILAEDLPDSYTIPPGGGGGGAHADSDHADAFSALGHTHAAHADSDHDDRFSLLAHAHAGVYVPTGQGVPVGGSIGQVLAKASATNYDTVWQSASAPAPQALDWLTDVNTTGQTSTNVLTYNGTSWVPAAIPVSTLGILGHGERTTAQTGISAATDLTGLSVTVTVAASRRIRISAQCSVVQRTTASTPSGTIQESTTTLGRWGKLTMATNDQALLNGAVVVSPSAGSHTYKMTLAVAAGTVDTIASATEPAWILVEDIGPV